METGAIALEGTGARPEVERGRARRPISASTDPGLRAAGAASSGHDGGGPEQHAERVPLPPADPSAIWSAVAMLWLGTSPSARTAPASRHPATITRPATPRRGPHPAQSA